MERNDRVRAVRGRGCPHATRTRTLIRTLTLTQVDVAQLISDARAEYWRTGAADTPWLSAVYSVLAAPEPQAKLEELLPPREMTIEEMMRDARVQQSRLDAESSDFLPNDVLRVNLDEFVERATELSIYAKQVDAFFKSGDFVRAGCRVNEKQKVIEKAT